MTKTNKIFYGWFIVAACFIVASTMGETFFAFGVFFKALESEFDWSRSIVSSAYTASIIGYSVSVVITGRLLDRYSPRFILLGAAILTGLGLCLSSTVTNIDQLRIYQFISGLGSGATFTMPNVVVQQWFHGRKDAGIALALVVCGIGVGQLIFPPLMSLLILNYGWRETYLLSGICFAVIIVVSMLVIKQSRNVGKSDSVKADAAKAGKTSEWNVIRKTMLTPAYFGMFYIATTGILSWQVISVHLVPYATDMGMPALVAAAALGLLGGMTIPGRFSAGFLCNKIGWQKSLGLSLYGMAAAVVFLLFIKTPVMLYAFVILFGVCWGIRAVAQWGILSDFFGVRSLGTLVGITSGVSTFIGGAGPYVAGFIVDTTGSYFIAFAIVAALMFSGGFIIMKIKKPTASSASVRAANGERIP